MSEFAGFTLSVSWGKAFNSNGEITYEDWNKSLKSKEEKFTEHLKPGHWNTIDFVLAPAKADELEYITIGMNVDEIVLASDRESPGMALYNPCVLEWNVMDLNASFSFRDLSNGSFEIGYVAKYPDTVIILCSYLSNVNRVIMNQSLASARKLIERRKEKLGYKWLKIEEQLHGPGSD
jgi:hypothetical protein